LGDVEGIGRTVHPVSRLAVIALGGVLGSVARYAVSLLVGPWDAHGLPWATLIVNVVGCLAIGIVATVAIIRDAPGWVRPFAITGVLGGFTTFSAFALETGVLLDSGLPMTAGVYVLVTMVTGLLAVRVGARVTGGALR
jgi:CrcB protein